jgi:molybdopterin converting factor small subunit
MKVNVKFLGLPMISDIIGKKKLEVEITGETVKDVIDEMIKCYGKKFKDATHDSQGNFDMMIQIALNENFIPPDKHLTPVKEGDELTFLMLLSGG